MVLFPNAYLLKSIQVSEYPKNYKMSMDCSEVVVARKGYESNQKDKFNKLAELSPGVLEKLLVMLNPTRNARRTSIELFVPNPCV